MTHESHDTRDSQNSTVLCIDLTGPYTIERKNKTKKPLTLWALTMIDPTRMIFDRGSEFKAELCQMIKNDYGVKVKPITTRNPQANAIVDRALQYTKQLVI